MVKPPPVTVAPRPQRRTVPVVALLAVILGGFLWGLAMFASGRMSAARGAQADTGTLALGQLNRLDQVIAGGDAVAARIQLNALALPDGPLWANAAALRRHAVEELERRQRQREAEAARLARIDQRLHPIGEIDAGLELIAVTVRPGSDDAFALATSGPAAPSVPLRSRDGGKRWTRDTRIAPAQDRLPECLRWSAPGVGGSLFIADRADATRKRLGWLSRDGGATLDEVPRPPKTGAPEGAERVAVGGDGTLVAVLRDGDGAWRCFASSDAGQQWRSGAPCVDLLLLASTTRGTLVVARNQQRQVQTSSDGGATFVDAEAEAAGWFAAEPAIESRSFPVADGICVLGGTRWALLADTGRLVRALPELPGGAWPLAVASHPRATARWYLLTQRHALLRSDDGGRSWRGGGGRLGELDGCCLTFAGSDDHPLLLIGGPRLWSLDDDAESWPAPTAP